MPENAVAVPSFEPARDRGQRSRAARAVAVLALLFAALLTVAVATSQAAEISEVNLAKYKRVGRYDLPSPANTTPPAHSLLAQEASGVAYDWENDHLYVVGDGGTSVVEVDKEGHLLSSMTLAPGNSPQGTTFYDTEDIAFLGGGKFVLTEERRRWIDRFTYVPGGELTRTDAQTIKLGTEIGNIGNEGVTNDPVSGGLILVKEQEPKGIFQTTPDWTTETASNGSATTAEPTNLFDPTKVPTLDFSGVFALANLPEISTAERGHLLIISQESGRVVNVDREGNVHSSLALVGDPDNPLSITAQTDEGVTMDEEGTLFIVNENGGGSGGHPQMWVYKPQTAADQPPTAVTLGHAVTSLPEATTAARVKLADVSVTDADGFGENDLSLAGPDASHFEVDSTGLFLKAGTLLKASTQAEYEVTVQVDDPAAGGSPDAVSSPYKLTVTPSGGGAGSSARVAVTEVAPWSSGESPFKADWFELTNVGATKVDLTGWKMNDNHALFSSAVPLEGVSSLAPGASAVFVNGSATTAEAFVADWFPGGAPAGFQIGFLPEVGLSTSGDQVNIYDSTGAKVSGVEFGSSPAAAPFGTFDNSEARGLGAGTDPTLTKLSTVGTNGAFAVNGGKEIGSPGTTGTAAPTPVAITEVAPWGSSETEYKADWFELTNETAAPLELSGWKMDDSSDGFATAVPLEGVSTLAPGESALFLETESATTVENFEKSWFGSALPAGLQVGKYHGSGVGLSGSGDGVNVFNAEGAHLTGVSFGAATEFVSFDNAAGLGSFGTPTPISTLSVEGVNGAFNAHDQIGSPGRTANPPAKPSVKITEVDPTGSSSTAYGADWFELTNTGSGAVTVSGWKMDDSSDAFATAVALEGVTTLAAGESALFLETESTATIEAFKTAWFGTSVPAGLQIGRYHGSGVGLSSGGDGVNVFNAAGEQLTGVSFGASTAGVSFDNSAGIGGTTPPSPTISTLSKAGFNGAFRNAGGEIGSPGAISGTVAILGANTPVFPTQAATTIGVGQWVTVTNEGGAAATVTRVRVVEANEESAGDFIVSADHCTEESIAAGGTCKVQVRFAPARANATSSAQLVVTSSARNSPLKVTLTGTSSGLPAGPEGPAGPAGPEGPAGPAGPAGPTGPEGPQGGEGPAGPAGPAGPTGPTGPTGPAGKEGKEGKQGKEGHEGREGKEGKPGKEGREGKEGKQGKEGKEGREGKPGKEGRQGPTGPAGPRGPAGKDGVVSFTSTEEEAFARRGQEAHLQFRLRNRTAGPLQGATVSADALETNGSATVHVATVGAGGSRNVTLALPVGRNAALGRHAVKVTMRVGGHSVTETVTVQVTR